MWTWLLWCPALASDVSFELIKVVAEGASPAITFVATVDGTVTANVQCGGKAHALKQAVPAGGKAVLALPVSVGEHACGGGVRFDRPNGDWAESPLQFSVAVRRPLSFKVDAADLDLVSRRLIVRSDRPVSAAEVMLIGVGGAVIATETASLVDPSLPSFTWGSEAEVVQLQVTAHDADGIGGTLELSPWSYAIPHEDVVFASGSHEITAAEAAKLERCWKDVVAVREKYGSVVAIELFVAGFTDTVGPAANNRALSERRAAVIARWFVDRGFLGPVWYQGFGEDALAVATGDEVDEVRNRRALYLLSAQPPPVSPALPASRWVRR